MERKAWDQLLTQLGLSPGELSGRTAVVTGGGSGIGEQAAAALCLLGARVLIAELSESGAQAVSYIAALGGTAEWIRTDVSDEASVAALAAALPPGWQEVSILINNAILCPTERLADTSAELWDRVMAVNLRGAFLTTRAFLPAMVRKDNGVIVNMVSTEAMPLLSAYIASKQGLVGLTSSIAAEVGECGVHVVALAPGMVSTTGLRRAAERLAPALGLTVDGLMSMSLHPAYQGLMPAEHAGAATAYLVARLAQQYHGEQVDGYTVLERAGLIPAASADVPPASDAAAAVPMPDLAGVLELISQLEGAIAETEAEFSRLPVFARPMARRGFRQVAGLTTQEWAALAGELAGTLGRAGAGRDGSSQQMDSQVEAMLTRLPKLATYYRQVPAQTARFTRDRDLLQQVQETVDGRLGVIDRLGRALSVLPRARVPLAAPEEVVRP